MYLCFISINWKNNRKARTDSWESARRTSMCRPNPTEVLEVRRAKKKQQQIIGPDDERGSIMHWLQ